MVIIQLNGRHAVDLLKAAHFCIRDLLFQSERTDTRLSNNIGLPRNRKVHNRRRGHQRESRAMGYGFDRRPKARHPGDVGQSRSQRCKRWQHDPLQETRLRADNIRHLVGIGNHRT